MIFTFEKRKKLNRQLREELPEYRFREDREGVPRMRIDRIPDGARPVDNTYSLRLMAYQYWEEYRLPMPVFITFGSGKELTVEVNYFDHDSVHALETAGRYVGEKRLYAFDML